MSGAHRELVDALGGDVRANELMARHTTFRVGGPADLFVTCETVGDLSEAVRILGAHEVPWVVVGKGSNLLVSDEGYRGAVLTLGREFKTHSVEGESIKAGGACILAYLVQDAFSHGLAGMEFAVGIPGTVGGALSMNAGSRGVWMDSVVESVTVFAPGKGLVRLRKAEIAWDYRRTSLPQQGIVVETVLRLANSDKDRIRLSMEASLRKRKAAQPLGMPSAGSVFTNPAGDSAGRLIETAGLKGMRLGGARVSDVHANFIVNEGGATASDVVRLMSKVQMTVRDVHGVELKPEIRFIGSFDRA